METELNKKIGVEKYNEKEKGIQEKGESLLWWEWWTTYVYGKEKDPYGMINYIVIKEFKNDKTALSIVYPAFVDPEKSQRYYVMDKYSYKDFSAEKTRTNVKIKDNTMIEKEKGIQEKGESLLWWEWWTTYVYGKEKDPYGMINYIVIKEFKNDKTALSIVYPAFVDPEKSQRYYVMDK